MTTIAPFQPKAGSNQILAATPASAIATLDRSNNQVRVLNSGAGKAYFRIFDSRATPGAVATTADYPILPNASATVSKGLNQDSIAYVSVDGTTLEVMTGEGW